MAIETIATRFANGTETESDRQAVVWQLERMDECEGGHPCTREGAIALLAELEQEQADECARNGHRDDGRGCCAECGEFI